MQRLIDSFCVFNDHSAKSVPTVDIFITISRAHLSRYCFFTRRGSFLTLWHQWLCFLCPLIQNLFVQKQAEISSVDVMWQFWCYKNNPCMMIFCSRCRSEVFYRWLQWQSCVYFCNVTVELHRFWIIRTVAVVISETGSGFPSMSHKAWLLNFRCIDVSAHLQFWCAECLCYLCIYLVFFPCWPKKLL